MHGGADASAHRVRHLLVEVRGWFVLRLVGVVGGSEESSGCGL